VSSNNIGVYGIGSIGVYGTTIAAGHSDSPFKVKTYGPTVITSYEQLLSPPIGPSKKVFAVETMISSGAIWTPAYAYHASYGQNIYSLYNTSTGYITVAYATGYTVRVIVIYSD
jgi:hypothetical protein